MPYPVALLGASDMEMTTIGQILKDMGVSAYHVLYANHRIKAKVYEATSLRKFSYDNKTIGDHLKDNAKFIFIECSHPNLKERLEKEGRNYHVVDHHYQGDPGFDYGPDKFFTGSSIGQLLDMLLNQYGIHMKGLTWTPCENDHQPGVVFMEDGYNPWKFIKEEGGKVYCADVPEKVLLVAATDHCLAAAYHGLCPGVDAEVAMRWRLESTARYKGIDPKVLENTINNTREILRANVKNGIVDVTGSETGTLPELPEAATREGVGAISKVRDRYTKKEKYIFNGAIDASLVQAWMEDQQQMGRETWGCPARGYAGSFI